MDAADSSSAHQTSANNQNTHNTLIQTETNLERQDITSGFSISMSFTTMLFMTLVVVAAVSAVIVYRMAVTEALSLIITFSYATTVATITGRAESSALSFSLSLHGGIMHLNLNICVSKASVFSSKLRIRYFDCYQPDFCKALPFFVHLAQQHGYASAVQLQIICANCICLAIDYSLSI